MSSEEPERLPTEHVGMNVKNGLPGIGIGVEHNPVPALEHTLELGNLTSGSNKVTQQRRIPSSKLSKVPVPLPRHNKHMNPSLRPNIPEGKGGLIRIDNIGRDLTSNDAFKESLVLTHGKNPIDQRPTSAPSQTTRAPTGTTRVHGWTTRAPTRTNTRRGPEARARQHAF
jgi:hypothetical protein